MPTFMEVLDTTIANVALNHIAGSMSASYSQSTWVLTSYLISNAVVLPLTAWLGNRFRRKRFLLFCIFLFTAASLMCGLSINLTMLLVMRVIQGIGGGALAPISQAILLESFPPQKQSTAQALFGLGVVVAPVVGPVLGGWLTDSYSWRWIFYINIPFGLAAIWAIQQTVEDPPWVGNADPGPLEALGITALSLWLGCQEIFLDKGQEDDWFGSRFIRTMAVLAVSGFVVFVWRELRAEKPMVDLRLFRVRNYSVATALIFLTCVLMYSIGLLTPQFLQLMLSYSAQVSGIATAPLRRDQIGTATGMLSLMRSVGIAWMSTTLARRSQVHQNMLGAHLDAGNLLLLQDTRGIGGYLNHARAAFGSGRGHGLGAVYQLLQQQAYLLAFNDAFLNLAAVAVVSILLIFLLRKVSGRV